MGYIDIPTIRVKLPILHGTEDATLSSGAGHLLGSSLPIGGESTHSVISAHSGVASQKLFSDLDKLKKGDVFYLTVLNETLAYQVDAVNTVLPHDVSLLGIENGKDLCTLVTCVPFGVNTHRLLVRGHRIPYEAAEAVLEEQERIEEPPKSTWMEQYIRGIVISLGVLCGLLLLAGVCWKMRKRGKYEAH